MKLKLYLHVLVPRQDGDLEWVKEPFLTCLIGLAELLLEDLFEFFFSFRAEFIRFVSHVIDILWLSTSLFDRREPNLIFIFFFGKKGDIVNYPETGLSANNFFDSKGISKLTFTTYFDCFFLFLYYKKKGTSSQPWYSSACKFNDIFNY